MSDRSASHRGPMLGEPLPLELANTTYAVRGRLLDGLHTVGQLAAWLGEVRSRLETPVTDQDLSAADEAQLAMARDVRDCVRELAAAIVDAVDPDPAILRRLNDHAHIALRWQELRWNGAPYAETRINAPPIASAICEIAQATVDLFTGPHWADVRRCGAPGCVLFFLKDHPRREWCSNSCGNRIRAARHYQRTRRALES